MAREAASISGAFTRSWCASLCLPTAARWHRRIGRRPVVKWALDAEPTDAGLGGPALIVAGVTARECTAPYALGTPRIAGRRLRRCGLDFAKKHRSAQEKRKNWRAHGGSPASSGGRPRPRMGSRPGPQASALPVRRRPMKLRHCPSDRAHSLFHRGQDRSPDEYLGECLGAGNCAARWPTGDAPRLRACRRAGTR